MNDKLEPAKKAIVEHPAGEVYMCLKVELPSIGRRLVDNVLAGRENLVKYSKGQVCFAANIVRLAMRELGF